MIKMNLSTSEVGIIVTILLFAIAHLAVLFRWGSNLDRSTGILANRMDSLADGLEKVENALAAIADVNTRFNYLQKTVADNMTRSVEGHIDHEKRLRSVESSCKACGPNL